MGETTTGAIIGVLATKATPGTGAWGAATQRLSLLKIGLISSELRELLALLLQVAVDGFAMESVDLTSGVPELCCSEFPTVCIEVGLVRTSRSELLPMLVLLVLSQP